MDHDTRNKVVEIIRVNSGCVDGPFEMDDAITWDNAVDKITSGMSVDKDGAEKMLNDLMETGHIYEPVLGVLKLT